MYDIVSGKVGIFANYGEENETLLTELGAGRYFGEMAVVDAMPRSATAVAIKDTELAVIEADEFNEYFKDQPGKVLNIIRNTSGRMRALTAQYVDA